MNQRKLITNLVPTPGGHRPMDTNTWNDPAIWNVLSSMLATDMEGRNPMFIPCKVRIKHTHRHFEVLAFVGRGSGEVCHDFVSELEARGYVVLGYGLSETESNWGVVVESLEDDDWTDCVTFEKLEIGGTEVRRIGGVSRIIEVGRSGPCR